MKPRIHTYKKTEEEPFSDFQQTFGQEGKQANMRCKKEGSNMGCETSKHKMEKFQKQSNSERKQKRKQERNEKKTTTRKMDRRFVLVVCFVLFCLM